MEYTTFLFNNKGIYNTRPFLENEFIKIKKGKAAYILVDSSVYQEWSTYLTKYKGKRIIGYVEGKKRKEIASLLFYSENTIKKDLSSIYKKLEVSDKSELIIKYKDLL